MAGLLEPQRLDYCNWYYEYPTYMLLVHEVRDKKGKLLTTDSIKIQWRKIQASLKRSYKPKRKPR
jgi:hypothetical protein